MKTGALQGGVLSPAQFNYYMADSPTPPANIKLIKYAEDIAIRTSGGCRNQFPNIYLSQLLYSINLVYLSMSTSKSTVTLFMPDTQEHYSHTQVKLVDQVLWLKKKPTVLLVTLDSQTTFKTFQQYGSTTQHLNNAL